MTENSPLTFAILRVFVFGSVGPLVTRRVHACVGFQGGEAKTAYQMLVIILFKHIEDVAASNPKYEHMVRLENYHFFAATIRPLKVGCSVGFDWSVCSG